ncbi:MAG: acetylglutamate kinase [Planctomycetota bacterium]|nr:acetylglutamate kinase [Planctomycetota bacterium]
MEGERIVLKIGGRSLDARAGDAAYWSALAALFERTRSVPSHAKPQESQPLSREPGGVVLVHGGGNAVDRQLDRLGLVSERRDGIRITPPEHVEQVVAMLAGVTNKGLAARINIAARGLGVSAIGLCLSDGNLARCSKSTRFSFDPGCVGQVDSGDPSSVRALWQARILPVVSSIGYDERGQALNINADDAAAAVARIIGAHAVGFISDVAGVRGRDGQTLPRLNRPQIEALIAEGVISGGMIPKVRAALDVAEQTGARVLILGDTPDVLAAMARGEAPGTTIVSA